MAAFLGAAMNEGRHSVSTNLAIASVAPVQTTLPIREVIAPAPAASTPAPSKSSAPSPFNPGLHLDPALNIVVLQFYDSKGEVTRSVPSQKQLQAYQQESGQRPPASHTPDAYPGTSLTAAG